MARPKKNASRGRGGGRGGGRARGGRHAPSFGIDFIPFAGTALPGSGSHGSAFQTETLNIQPSSSSDQRLRHTKVNFISAGGVQPSVTTDPESAMAVMSLKGPSSDLDEASEVPDDSRLAGDDTAAEKMEEVDEREDEFKTDFIIDIEGSQPIQTGLPAPHIRPPSPTPSNSSEEIILFGGRDSNGKGLIRAPSSRYRSPIASTRRMIINDDVIACNEVTQYTADPGLVEKDRESFNGRHRVSKKPLSTAQKAPRDSVVLNSQKHGRRNHRHRTATSDEDALMADYIANLKEQGLDLSEPNNPRELGGSEGDMYLEAEKSTTGPPKKKLDDGWNQSDLSDFDNLSTSNEVLGSVEAVLSRRDRKSGRQYLVVWEDSTVDEARWVPETTLSTPQAVDLIDKFEAEENLIAQIFDSDESDSGTDDLAAAFQSGDSEDDDIDLVQRQMDSMTDEKIARLFAKQEEIGLESAELLLFDGLDEEDVHDDFILPGRSNRRSRRGQKGLQRPNGGFHSAGVLADAYDGFDVMDFERPSLKVKSKDRKGKLPFDLSNPELEVAWDNDREKKKKRKQEREELRASGLLGNNRNKPDLKIKYKEGMGIHAIKDEIRSFLMGDNTTLSLPPMEKGDRKVVHEIANAFNLKSKSAGSGRKRFPVLYRTQRTRVYVEGTFNAVEARITRRFLPRMDVKGKNPMARMGSGGLRGTAVTYRDGDVVGGSAPELGIENRGRAMLEKMGWSSGTALGALNNKGILQPVSHVVKTTKAGLG